MGKFRLKELKYLFKGGEYKNVSIPFKDLMLIYGENTSGKTGIFHSIDTLLGRDKIDYIKFENKFQYSSTLLTYEFDNFPYTIEYVYEYPEGERKLKEVIYKGQPIAKDLLNNQLTLDLFGNVFESDTKFGIRNMVIFNFFHEHNVGSPTVLLSKLREQFFYRNIQDTFQLALFNETNQIYNLKLELKDLKQSENILKTQLEATNNSNKEINEINNLLNGEENNYDDVKKENKTLQLNELRNIKKQIIDNKILDAEINFLIDVRLMAETSNELGELEETLKIIKQSLLNKKYLKDNISKSIRKTESELMIDESSKKVALINLFKEVPPESVSELETKLEKIDKKIKDIKKTIIRQEKIFEHKIKQVENTMKQYLLNIENSELQEIIPQNFDIKISGNSFDPVIIEKYMLGEEEKEKVISLSSHSLLTLFQICYIFALHTVAQKNEGCMLDFIVFDTYSQPFEASNKKVLIDTITTLQAEANTQVIMLDKDIEVLNYCRKLNIKEYLIENKLFEEKD